MSGAKEVCGAAVGPKPTAEELAGRRRDHVNPARLRVCSFCDRVDLLRGLVHYSVRRYAHAPCLVYRKGWIWMIQNLPEYPLVKAARMLAHNRIARSVLASHEARA